MVNVKYTVIELNLYLMVHSIVLKFEKIWLSHTLNIIWKPKKSLFSKRKRAITHERQMWNTPTVIKFNLYFMVHSNLWKFEKIWLSHTLNIIRKPKKSLFSKRKRAITHERQMWNTPTVIKLNLNFMVHSNLWKFEKIWFSGTLIIIRKPKVWRTNGHEQGFQSFFYNRRYYLNFRRYLKN
jgi:hypothetical protein